MAPTLEQRLSEVEKKVAALDAVVGNGRPKDWLASVGTLNDDDLSRKAERLGREYRERMNDSERAPA